MHTSLEITKRPLLSTQRPSKSTLMIQHSIWTGPYVILIWKISMIASNNATNPSNLTQIILKPSKKKQPLLYSCFIFSKLWLLSNKLMLFKRLKQLPIKLKMSNTTFPTLKSIKKPSKAKIMQKLFPVYHISSIKFLKIKSFYWLKLNVLQKRAQQKKQSNC